MSIPSFFELVSKLRFNYLIYFIFGLVSALSFAPYFIIVTLMPVFLILVYNFMNTENVKKLFWHTWFLFWGHFVGGCYWIFISLTLDIEKFFWLIPFAILVLPGYMALFPALAVAFTKFFFKHKNFKLSVFSLAASFVFFEIVRENLFTGFPWNNIGYIWANNIYFIQIASYFGIYGLSFITIILFALISYSLLKNNLKAILITSIIFILNSYYGFKKIEYKTEEYTKSKVLIVQANIPQDLKWDPKEKYNGVLKHIAMSSKVKHADLIIWPEAAFPYAVNTKYKFNDQITSIISNDGALLTGAVKQNNLNEVKIYNSAFVVNKEGTIIGSYDKKHLVPFGEYVPFSKFLPIHKITSGMLDTSEGSETENGLIEFNDELKIIPLICYEAIFPRINFEHLDHANLIVNITNDTWFGNSSGPYQHFYMSRIRAIESGLPLVRAANSGVSAIIDPYGRILKQTVLNVEDTISSHIPRKRNSKTFFAKHVNYYSIISTILLIWLTVYLLPNSKTSANVKKDRYKQIYKKYHDIIKRKKA